MYDKYNSLTPFTVGATKLPKHKGIVLSGNGASLVSYVLNSNGTTGSATFAIQTGVTILPFEFYAVTNLNGLTGWLLN